MMLKRRIRKWIKGTSKSIGLKSKVPFLKAFSLGLLVLGLCCISWGLINIGSQSLYATDAYLQVSPHVASVEWKRPIRLGEDLLSAVPKDTLDSPSSLSVVYPIVFSEGDDLGSLTIPSLNLTLPIVEGTSDASLKKGVGHFAQSVLPGLEDNCVLSGHRDTVFTNLGNVKIGDLLVVETSAGVFSYEVSGTRIVEKDDRTVIVPTDHAVLTLTTCYPFRYIGNAPQRYIVSADLISTK